MPIVKFKYRLVKEERSCARGCEFAYLHIYAQGHNNLFGVFTCDSKRFSAILQKRFAKDASFYL
jgi:hypothetical protein